MLVCDNPLQRKRGRPVRCLVPLLIPDTRENVLKASATSPPKKRGDGALLRKTVK